MANNQAKGKKIENRKYGTPPIYPRVINMPTQRLHLIQPQSQLMPNPPGLLYPMMVPSWPTPHPNINPQYLNQKICLVCQKSPKFSCYRCGAFYCSKECQSSDWPSHRFNCFSMPPLVPLKGTTRTVPPISPLPKNAGLVLLTGFRRPNLCYVRSLDPEDDEQYKKGAAAISKFASSAQIMSELPTSNTYAFAPYKEDYHRVQVLSVSNPDSIRVLLIDVGVVKTVCLTELRKICENAIKILQLAVAVKLKGVENYLASEEIDKFLDQFCEKKFILKYNEEDEDKEFVLTRLDSINNLNETIITFANKQKHIGVYKDSVEKQSVVPCSKIDRRNLIKNNLHLNVEGDPKSLESVEEDMNEIYHIISGSKIDRKNLIKNNLHLNVEVNPKSLEPPFQFIQFGEDDKNLVVTILNAWAVEKGLFSCIMQNNQKYLNQLASYFKTYVDTQSAYEPQLNEYCLANINKKWCRVKILKMVKNMCTVINIDTTVENNIRSNQMRRYPADLTIPCTTVPCKIEGLQPVTGNKLIGTFLKENFTVNSTHRINKVNKIEGGVRYVEMDGLIDELILHFRFNLK